MKKIASSTERHTFQKEGAIKRAEEAGEEPNQAYIEMWEQIKIDDANKIHDPAWQRTIWSMISVAQKSYAIKLKLAMPMLKICMPLCVT